MVKTITSYLRIALNECKLVASCSPKFESIPWLLARCDSTGTTVRFRDKSVTRALLFHCVVREDRAWLCR